MKLFDLRVISLALATFVPFEKAHAGGEPMIADVMLVGFNFCPIGWAQMNGQLLSISSNQALFSLLGTHYGGDGRTTFALPDMRGRYIVNNGSAASVTTTQIGQKGGQEYVTMTSANLAPHTHVLTGSPTGYVRASTSAPSSNSPENAALPTFPESGNSIYNETQTTPAVMGNGSIKLTTESVNVGSSGGSIEAFNIQPTLALTACMAVQGLFPSRN